MTLLRMKLKNQSKETLKGNRRQKCCRGRRCTFIKAYRVHWKKSSRNKNIPKSEKKPNDSSTKTKSTKENIYSNPQAPKIGKKSSSRLKLVPEKLRNYFTEQDEEYFSSQETDDVFVARTPGKK